MSRAIKIGSGVVNGINFDTMECYVGDDEEKNIKGERVEYQLPSSVADMRAFTANADDALMGKILSAYAYGWGLQARSAARPGGGGVTLPEVSTKKWGRLNLFTGEFGKALGKDEKDGTAFKWEGKPLPLAQRLAMINSEIMRGIARQEQAPRGVLKAVEELTAAKLVAVRKDGTVEPSGK